MPRDRDVWRIAAPMVLSNVSVPLLGMVDTGVVGHLESAVYIGAVAIGSTIFSFLYSGMNFLRMGTTGIAAQPFQVSANDLVWLATFGSVFAAATILMTIGLRHVPAAQAAVIGAMETPLAPVWAWLILAELPPAATWIGGAIVFAAALWNIKASP